MKQGGVEYGIGRRHYRFAFFKRKNVEPFGRGELEEIGKLNDGGLDVVFGSYDGKAVLRGLRFCVKEVCFGHFPGLHESALALYLIG